MRDEIVDYVNYWTQKTELSAQRLVGWLGLGRSKYQDWQARYGKVNEHNAWVPRDFWLEPGERRAILDFHDAHPREGYRRLTYQMMDADVVAASPASVYRVLKQAGRLTGWNRKPSAKGRGFEQPTKPHEHWHTDISYLNVCGTFYYLCSVLDGFSRSIVHGEIHERMRERDVTLILQRALEKFPQARPRVISDNGPQFLARDFKEFIRICGMTHVKTSPYYPQSNGKVERWHQSLKRECIRPQTPLSLEDARRVVARFVEEYNTRRLHSGIGYVTPQDKLDGRAEAIHAAREAKLAAAREQRRRRRQAEVEAVLTAPILPTTMPLAGETDASSAGTQLARDSRPGIRPQVERGALEPQDSPALLPPAGDSPHASENPDLPPSAASRRLSLISRSELSISG